MNIMKEILVYRIANLIYQINIYDVKWKLSEYESAYFVDYKNVSISQKVGNIF